jgi:iron-sulfur cluster assembly accessory protein
MRRFLRSTNVFSNPLRALFSTKPAAKRERKLPTKSAIEITEGAAERVKALMDSKKGTDVVGIRLNVKTRGCNGLSFVMDYQDPNKVGKFDEKVSAHGVDVYIDSKAVFYIVGTKMDWVEDDLRAEFTFDNPNAKGTCGCGESFNV